jgi:hypothetical protein
LEERINTTNQYKLGPHARYLVDKMVESEKTMLEVVNKLPKKMDSYDKRLTTMGSDITKVQSQVDLSMRSIQMLQKEQILLVKSVVVAGGSSVAGAVDAAGVMGSSPASTPDAPAASSLLHHQGAIPQVTSSSALGDHHQEPYHADHRRPWLPKMDFPRFDGPDVRIWLDKRAAYFQMYAIPADFRVTTTSLHMVDRATNWYQSYKYSTGVHSWEHFVVAVSHEFEVNTHRVNTMALINMR